MLVPNIKTIVNNVLLPNYNNEGTINYQRAGLRMARTSPRRGTDTQRMQS